MAIIIAWMLLSAMMGNAQAGGCGAANVSAGDRFTCAVLQNGSARCWGQNDFIGQPGRPDNTATSHPMDLPPLDFGAGRTVLQLATYDSSSCALLDDHTMSCWGRNEAGQLGQGDTRDRSQPTHVQLGTGNQSVQLISTGSRPLSSCAVVTGEGVVCWGSAAQLQGTPWFGEPSSQDINGTQVILPSKVDMGSNSSSLDVIDMCAGSAPDNSNAQTCVLTAQLGLKCWGIAGRGQLGLGNITDTTSLTGLSLPSVNLGTGRSAVQISCGGSHTCAVLDNGMLKCFGDNTNGQLGYGDTVSRGANITDMGDNLKPVDVGKGRTVKQVSAGSAYTCALLDSGQVKCWGDNFYGQLGHHCSNSTWGSHTRQMGDSLPAVDLGPNRSAVSISAGAYHSCAVLDDDSIKCWGDNLFDEMGSSNISASVCPPNQTVDLGSSCTSSTVGGNSTGPGNSSQLPPAPSPTMPPTPTPSPLQATISKPSTSTLPSPLPSPSTTTTTASTSTATAPSSPSSSHSTPVGIIAGAVIAAVVVVALSGWAVWWWRTRRQGRPTRGAASFLTRSKQTSAQVVAIASDEVAMNIAPEVGAVHSAADIKLDLGAAINTVSTKADVQGASYSHTASTAAPSPGALPEARSTPPLTSTGSHKTDARDTNTSKAASAAAHSSGILREGSVESMLVPWSHITLGGLLGEGGFGKVYKAKWRMNTVAVKVLNMKKASTSAIDNLHREALIMSELRHPCIARVFGVVDEDPHHALVMQYYPKGTLQKYMATSEYAVLELPAKLHIALQVASGMQFMHERTAPVLHGDLKAANILLTAPGRSIVIADFGLSQAMLVGQKSAVASGALTYSISPPEVLNNPLAPRTRAADVYAFAIVLLEIYTGMPCFRGMRVTDIRRLVTAGQRPSLPADMPPCIADIIKACWSQDPASRPTFTGVVEQVSAAAAELHMDCFTDGTVTTVSTQTMTDW